MKESVLDCIHTIAVKLEPVYHDSVEQQQAATWILEAITGKSEAELLAEKKFQLTHEQELTLADWLEKHINKHMPLQYLLGTVPFIDLTITVKPPVLIPRPETEEWCYNVIQLFKKLPDKRITILDLCTGTGCIALAIAQALPEATVIATDISEQALHIARQNAKDNTINNITFLKSDLFEHVSCTPSFDCIVSNPPYIDIAQWNTLDPMVKNWEDKQALVAPDHGLAIIKEIVNNAKKYLKKNDAIEKLNIPQLVLEIDYDQGPTVTKIAEKAGLTRIAVVKDLEGKDRVLYAYL